MLRATAACTFCDGIFFKSPSGSSTFYDFDFQACFSSSFRSQPSCSTKVWKSTAFRAVPISHAHTFWIFSFFVVTDWLLQLSIRRRFDFQTSFNHVTSLAFKSEQMCAAFGFQDFHVTGTRYSPPIHDRKRHRCNAASKRKQSRTQAQKLIPDSKLGADN